METIEKMIIIAIIVMIGAGKFYQLIVRMSEVDLDEDEISSLNYEDVMKMNIVLSSFSQKLAYTLIGACWAIFVSDLPLKYEKNLLLYSIGFSVSYVFFSWVNTVLAAFHMQYVYDNTDAEDFELVRSLYGFLAEFLSSFLIFIQLCSYYYFIKAFVYLN